MGKKLAPLLPGVRSLELDWDGRGYVFPKKSRTMNEDEFWEAVENHFGGTELSPENLEKIFMSYTPAVANIVAVYHSGLCLRADGVRFVLEDEMAVNMLAQIHAVQAYGGYPPSLLDLNSIAANIYGEDAWYRAGMTILTLYAHGLIGIHPLERMGKGPPRVSGDDVFLGDLVISLSTSSLDEDVPESPIRAKSTLITAHAYRKLRAIDSETYEGLSSEELDGMRVIDAVSYVCKRHLGGFTVSAAVYASRLQAALKISHLIGMGALDLTEEFEVL